MRRTPWQRIVLACVTMVSLSGCSSAGSGETLEEVLGFTPERWRSLIDKRDAAVVACMARAGFEFRVSTDWKFWDTAPHGAFDVTTPLAVPAYLRQHGYGLVERLESLEREKQDLDRVSNQEVYDELVPDEQRRFQEVLYGPAGDTGCAGEAADLAGGVVLPEGGLLGDDYGAAIGQLYESSRYERWADDVVECMAAQGTDVSDGDLEKAQRPHLIRLLEITKSKYEIVDGRVHYSMNLPERSPKLHAELSALRRGELRTAAVEADCRVEHQDEMHALMAEASADLIEEHDEEIQALAGALLDSDPQPGASQNKMK